MPVLSNLTWGCDDGSQVGGLEGGIWEGVCDWGGGDGRKERMDKRGRRCGRLRGQVWMTKGGEERVWMAMGERGKVWTAMEG